MKHSMATRALSVLLVLTLLVGLTPVNALTANDSVVPPTETGEMVLPEQTTKPEPSEPAPTEPALPEPAPTEPTLPESTVAPELPAPTTAPEGGGNVDPAPVPSAPVQPEPGKAPFEIDKASDQQLMMKLDEMLAAQDKTELQTLVDTLTDVQLQRVVDVLKKNDADYQETKYDAFLAAITPAQAERVNGLKPVEPPQQFDFDNASDAELIAHVEAMNADAAAVQAFVDGLTPAQLTRLTFTLRNQAPETFTAFRANLTVEQDAKVENIVNPPFDFDTATDDDILLKVMALRGEKLQAFVEPLTDEQLTRLVGIVSKDPANLEIFRAELTAEQNARVDQVLFDFDTATDEELKAKIAALSADSAQLQTFVEPLTDQQLVRIGTLYKGDQKALDAFLAGLTETQNARVTALWQDNGILRPENMTYGDFFKIITKNTYAVSSGAVETNMVLNDETATNQNKVYVMEVDMSNPNITVMPSYKDMDPTQNFGTQVMSQQAAAAERLGYNVVGGINTNLSWSTLEPFGKLVINGTVYCDQVDPGSTYLAVDKNNKAEIREGTQPLDGSEYQAVTANFGWIVKNGQVCVTTPEHTIRSRAPRTCFGIKENGDLVLLVVDGRQNPISVGMSMNELGNIMKEMGCVDAVNCDGGGSSTFLSKREGGRLSIKNVPSDGSERATLCGLLVVSTAVRDGKFDHASITSENNFVTPSSEVQLTAAGVDAGGGPADLPAEGLTWRVADETMGTVTADGVFTSSGKLGDAVIELLHNEQVVGSYTLTMLEPDTLYFLEDHRSIGLSSSADLEMVMQYEGKTIRYSGKDFTWRYEILSANDSSITDPAVIGHVEPDSIHFVSNATKSGDLKVTAVYTRQDGTEVTADVQVDVGKEPYVFWDYEDGVQTVEVWEEVTDEVDASGNPVPPYWHIKRDAEGNIVYEDKYFTAEEYYHDISPVSAGSPTVEEQMSAHFGMRRDRGGKGHTEIVDLDSGEPVRFGQKSMKLCYDFTGVTGSPATVGYGYMQNTNNAPGSPTGIGMWIYVPEGTPAYTLKSVVQSNGRAVYLTYTYTYVNEKGETVTTANMADMAGKGWIYVYSSLVGRGNGIFKMLKMYTVRIICEGTQWAPEKKTTGAIYVDNIEFVYGYNDKDTSNPIVHSVYDYATDAEIAADGTTVFDQNTLSFASKFDDYEEKTATGMDLNSIRVYIDGVNMSKHEGFVVTKDNMMVLPNVHLANGLHSISVRVRDNYGNETTETRYFTVKGTEVCDTYMTMEPVGSPVLGQKYSVALNAANAANITGFDVTAKFNTNFGEPTVTFADGINGTYTYNANNGELTIHATGTASQADAVQLATVNFQVPADLNHGAAASFGVVSGTFTTATQNTFTNSFSAPTAYVPVTADYHMENTTPVVNMPFEVTVLDAQDQPVAGASIHVDGVAQTGVTDAQGKMTLTITTAGEIVVSATTTDEAGATHYSWNKSITIHSVLKDAELAPFYIQNNFVGTGIKSFTWLSSLTGAQDKAILRVYTEDPAVNPEAAYTDHAGTTEIVSYATEAARINTVRAADLPESYYYQVGDGTNFSEVLHASSNGGNTDFYILGDVQTTSTTNTTAITNMIKADGVPYDFSIQVGDFVDDSTRYAYWDALSQVFDAKNLGSVDMIHVMGNHEYYGNESGLITRQMWDLPAAQSGSYYSVERGDVYVAVINFSLTGTYEEALEWLVQDARASSARWKVLTMHAPAFCTNPEAHNSFLHNNLPAAAEQAGLDFVFAGHDHAYARTEPVRGGQVDKNGVVYYICGAVGDKEYNITDNPDYHFAITDGTYKAMYMQVSANAESFSVKAINKNGEVIDTYTKQYVPCADGVHTYEVNTADATIVCRECGNKPTGIMEVSGELYYAMDGKLYSGWRSALEGTDLYYFDPATYAAVTGKATVDNKEFTFNEQGVLVRGAFVKEADGTKYYFGPKYLNHKWINLEEGTYLALENGNIAYGYIPHQEFNHGDYTWYHFDEQTGLLTGKCSGFLEYQGQTYYCDAEGLVHYGAIQVEDGIIFSGTLGKVYKNQDCYIEADMVGDLPLEQGVYYCNEQGRIVSDGFVQIKGNTYYMANYKKAKGFTKIGEDYYLFNAGNGKMYKDANMWVNDNAYGIESGVHYFGVDGKMFVPDLVNGQKAIIEENGNLYFTIDGVKMTNGINELNGEYYNSRTNGALSRGGTFWVDQTNGLLTDQNGFYGFDADGKLVKNGFVDNGKNTYYYKDAARAKGFTKIGEDYYLFNAGSGMMYKDANMWVNDNAYGVEAGVHYFGVDGKMFVPDLVNGQKAIIEENGNLYFTIDGVKMTNGINELNGEYYNSRTNGVLSRGGTFWVDQTNDLLADKNGFFGFDADGKLIKNGFVDNGKNTYYYKDAARAKGFTKIGNDYYLFNAGSGMMYKDANMWVNDNAYGVEAGMHYFGVDGKMFVPDLVNGQKAIIEENGNLYFTIDGVKMTNGINELNGEYYNSRTNGALSRGGTFWVDRTNGLLADQNGFYGFDADGKLVKNGFVDNGKNTYYYKDAARAKGFTKIGNDYYLFNAGSGMMYKDANMWVNDNAYGIKAGMYYFGLDGKMALK